MRAKKRARPVRKFDHRVGQWLKCKNIYSFGSKEIADAHGSVLVVGWANEPKNTDDPGSYEWLKHWAERQKVSFADWYPNVASVGRASRICRKSMIIPGDTIEGGSTD